ncbi:alpha/beta fold hydrolase [Streptomyces sp. PKU-EA00015]|uniref:alpha/beta fold hydrolase n=1 Tax=Streptomyces sp. PKU-EA00015 TaxID=2748326 RepID=UPI0015A1EC41|nr:alpha/beta hydrolase [Streptomyces sp. PKU-EA00015]NWF25174.1 alpha/beta fold hydrolase [Streptomyces sp. PKU-EA00015]
MENSSRTLNRTESADGTRIVYEQRGEGPALVLVGGALCTAASDAPLAELLAERFTVFTYDRRGRGSSGDTAPYAVEREAEDLAAVIAQAGGCALVHGTSSGAALALRAASDGLPIAMLSVYEPPFETDPELREARRSYEARMRALLAEGRPGDALAEFLGAVGMPPEALWGLRQLPVWADMEALAPTLAYDHEVMGDGSVPAARLAAVTERVLVVDGGASPAGMREAARAVAAALPRGRHRTLTGQRHEVAPHVLAPTLIDFFAG